MFSRKTTQILFLSLLALSTGCSTSQTVQNLNRPVVQLQKLAEVSSPAGLAKVSRNGREFRSNYFAANKGKWEAYKGENQRFFSLIKVLGHSRPYTLEIAVYEQRKVGESKFTSARFSESMTTVLRRRVEKSLHGSADGMNVIDDFRVF